MKTNFDLRVEKGSITMRQLAKHLGVHHNTLNKWFNNKETMNAVRYERVLRAIKEIKGEK